MIPVSGAKQSKYSGPIGKHPMISHTGAFEVGERVGIVALGQEHVHSPATFDLALNSFIAAVLRLVDLALVEASCG